MKKPKTDTKKWQEMKRRVAALGKVHVDVGAFGGVHSSGLTIAELLAIHEYGTATVPARAPMATTFVQSRKSIGSFMAKVTKAVVEENKMTPDQGMALVGEFCVSEIRKTIIAGLAPPLEPETIKRKGSSTPLVDSGQLINGITYRTRVAS